MIVCALSISPSDGRTLSHDESQSNSTTAGPLISFAHRARAEGKTEVNLPPSQPLLAGLEPLDAALLHNTVIVATFLQSESRHDHSEIFTWRKFRLREQLTRQAKIMPPDMDLEFEKYLATAPKAMLPLAAGEFLMCELGGTVTIDGVKVTQPGSGTQALSKQGMHLLFVLFGDSDKLAIENYGPIGFFTIGSSDDIHARRPQLDSDEANPLLREIRMRTNCSLSAMRSLAAASQRQR